MINNKLDNYRTERKQAIETLKVIAHRFGTELTQAAEYKGFVDEENAALVTAYVQAERLLLDLLNEELG